MILLALLSVPLSVLKNGIRIATLTLLSIYVDPDFLTGKLHHEGGFVFFVAALLILWPVFLWLVKSEKTARLCEFRYVSRTRAIGNYFDLSPS